MPKYKALPVKTRYWKPKDNYLAGITAAVENKLKDGDYIVVSEKAISTATGNIIDENKIVPRVTAKFLSGFWMRAVWGYGLGVLCHFGPRLLTRLRNYPTESGSRHKQVALEHAGYGQALMFGSEGGIDGSNLPYSLVSLPLKDTSAFAETIRQEILQKLGREVCIVIVDTDKTYRLGGFFFTPRPRPLKGIHSFGIFALAAYIFGKALGLRKSSTPLAVAGSHLGAAEALKIANIADRARGPGSGATVWDMASRFHAPVNGVTWGMLEMVEHKPVVIVRAA
jgi:F420-0:gamma-glutamyl ligase-like protein